MEKNTLYWIAAVVAILILVLAVSGVLTDWWGTSSFTQYMPGDPFGGSDDSPYYDSNAQQRMSLAVARQIKGKMASKELANDTVYAYTSSDPSTPLGSAIASGEIKQIDFGGYDEAKRRVLNSVDNLQRAIVTSPNEAVGMYMNTRAQVLELSRDVSSTIPHVANAQNRALLMRIEMELENAMHTLEAIAASNAALKEHPEITITGRLKSEQGKRVTTRQPFGFGTVKVIMGSPDSSGSIIKFDNPYPTSGLKIDTEVYLDKSLLTIYNDADPMIGKVKGIFTVGDSAQIDSIVLPTTRDELDRLGVTVASTLYW